MHVRTRSTRLAATIVVTLLSASAAAAAPQIGSVSGCSGDDGTGRTSGCPAAGNIPITIIGTNFGASEGAVQVDGEDCPPDSWGDNFIVCHLPSGTGQERLVSVIDASGVSSEPVRDLSYADPEITSADCGGGAACARTGGQPLTIHGSNFGTGSARVFVGGEPCDDDGVADDDTQITCTLPPGSGQDVPLLVVTREGSVSPGGASLSYDRCSPGSFADGLACSGCGAGTFSDEYDATACRSCPAGSFSSSGGATSCEACAAGQFQSATGHTSCDDCAAGSSSAEGSSSCVVRDTLQCWKTKDLKSPPFEATKGVSISDALSSGQVDVKKPALVCLPASVTAMGPFDPAAWQCCYKVSGDKLDPPAQRKTSDAFGGTLSVELSKKDLVCEPCEEQP